jgi:hypothetical protein
MSFDHYQFHMVLRQEEMTRAERLAADERAARIVQVMVGPWRAISRTLRPAARPLAALQLRRNP